MRRRLIVCVCLLLACSAGSARADEPQFMAIFMDDTKVGHVRSQRVAAADKVTHRTQMALALGRGAVSILVRIDEKTIETSDGRPLSFQFSSSLGMGDRRGVIRDGKIELPAPDGSAGRVVPYPQGALMPEGLRLLQRKHGLKPGAKYSCVAFEPSSMKGILTEVVIGERVCVPLIGRTAELIPVAATIHYGGTQLETMTHIDESFEARKVEMGLMGLKLRMVACDEQYANSPNGRFDLAGAGSVPSPVRIADPRAVRRATFTLAPADAEAGLMLPTTDSQKVTRLGDGVVTVRVELVQPGRGVRPYRGDDTAALAALKPSEYVQSEHAELVELARRVVGDRTNAMAAAKAIEAWVDQHVAGDMSVGYASALETLRSAAGDCTEYAVLTAALCRAAGVPCRIVVGVVYAEQFGRRRRCFIGHAWNQAYVAGGWVDVDAAIGADAARITLAVGGDDPTAFIAVVKSLGAFKITQIRR